MHVNIHKGYIRVHQIPRDKISIGVTKYVCRGILEKYKVYHMFDCVEYRQTNQKAAYTKRKMLKRIKSKTNTNYSNMIIFDDNFYHCMEAKCLGIKYWWVTGELLRWQDIKKGLCLFKRRSRSKSCHL
jgi:hypothetical protein